MSSFLTVLLYLGGHFLAYALVLRHLRLFKRESPIFLYHLASFFLLGLWLGTSRVQDIAGALGILSLHGIYSVSFLELWALSYGGYSLRILESIEKHGQCAEEALESMRFLGMAKKKGRLDTLRGWRLVEGEGKKLRLTLFGRLFAASLDLIAWPSNGRA